MGEQPQVAATSAAADERRRREIEARELKQRERERRARAAAEQRRRRSEQRAERDSAEREADLRRRREGERRRAKARARAAGGGMPGAVAAAPTGERSSTYRGGPQPSQRTKTAAVATALAPQPAAVAGDDPGGPPPSSPLGPSASGAAAAPPPKHPSLKGPTAKAAAALAAAAACAAAAGYLLGLPLPLLGGGPSAVEAESAHAQKPVAISPGTPMGLSKGPFHPVVTEDPDYGESAARFGADRGGRKHEGQDVFARPGTPLVAVRDGIVLDGGGGNSFYSYGGGNTFVMYSPIDDRSYVYLHMLKPALVRAGERVKAGELIGRVGCTGSCDGPHLHFEVRDGRAVYGPQKKAIDPLPLLRQWPVRPTG